MTLSETHSETHMEVDIEVDMCFDMEVVIPILFHSISFHFIK